MTARRPGLLARQELAARLEHERDRLRQSLRWHAEPGIPGDGGEAGAALDEVERAARLAVEYAEWERLSELETLLRHLAEADPDDCELCGEPLDLERLYALA